MAQTTLTIDSKTAQSIANSRKTLTPQHVGQQVLLQIVGNGNFLSAAEQETQNPGQKAYFDKYIYNFKANSLEAIQRPESKKLLKEAFVAESEGNTEEAHKLFNEWLNAIQVSFNVIADRGHRFQDGDMATCVVEESDTKTGHKAIVVNNVRYKAPAAVAAVKFDLTSLMEA